MSHPSTYSFRNSLPLRSPSLRPRSLSLADYAPIPFDRDAFEAHYHASVSQPSSATVSSTRPSAPPSNPSFPSSGVGQGNGIGGFGSSSGNGASDQTHGTYTSLGSGNTSSTLSHHLRAGDNPHTPPHPPVAPIQIAPADANTNHAGVGAGHALSPPSSPMHKDAQQMHQAILNGFPSPRAEQEERERPPTPPPRPAYIPASTFHPSSPMSDDGGFRRHVSDMYIDEDGAGYMTDPGSGRVVDRNKGKRRSLPPPPSNVPIPEPPAWEPDYKTHIPQSLTAPSVAAAYAQLSAPPPNLPPRRGESSRPAAVRHSTGNMAYAAPAGLPPDMLGTQGGQPGPSTARRESYTAQTLSPVAVDPNDVRPPPPSGVTGMDSPESGSVPQMTEEPGTLPTVPPPNRPPAEKGAAIKAEGFQAIWSTHYIDPSLRNVTGITIPQQVTNITNVALTGLSSGPKTRYNTTTGAPIDGMARMAKDWLVPPDGKFESEKGGIELSLAIVDGKAEGWGRDKGRQRARIDVKSKSGGIKFDVMELDPNRQIDLKVDAKAGDVLILLPYMFYGAIHVTSGERPQFMFAFASHIQPIANPYASFYTTFFVPGRYSDDKKKSKSFERNTMAGIQKWVPKKAREQSDILDQVAGGFASHTRGEQSKVVVTAPKGRVVFALRETEDEQKVEELGLKVGREGTKKKKFWQ